MFDTADFFIDRVGSHFGAYCKAFNSFADLFYREMSSCTICCILKSDPLRSISKLTCLLGIYIIP